MPVPPDVIVLISADAEWKAVRELYPKTEMQRSPFGEWFMPHFVGQETGQLPPCIFFHGGWGKISAAASTQYAIDRWQPRLLVNLGTCGGFEGAIEPGAVILVKRTVVYDIVERMGDLQEHIRHYACDLDLSWLDFDLIPAVQTNVLVSGDRDLAPEDLAELRSRYGAVAGDWESGAIAWVAQKNGVRCLILRAVSDLVGGEGSPAYSNLKYFQRSSAVLMRRLVEQLPKWLRAAAS